MKLEAVVTNPAAFSNFSWTVSFLLVFRTSPCFSRFWACATGASTMRSQMFEACATLISFAASSKTSELQTKTFKHTVVHLFSTFHAMAVAAVSNQTDREFPVVGADYMPTNCVEFLRGIPGE